MPALPVKSALARGGTAAVLACLCCSALAAAEPFTEEDVSAAVLAFIDERSMDGVLHLHDAATGDDLELVLDDIRVVRGLAEFGWFPDVIFHDHDTPAKKYTVDFWLKPDGDRLEFMDARVHKGPQPDGDAWMMITRQPLLWWWLPTLKRASAFKDVQAWQIMGAIHEHIVRTTKDGAFPLAAAGGKSIPAELVAIYQPVGRKHRGDRYFACALLRNKGNPSAVYAVDFQVAPGAGSVTVGTARLQTIPRADNGKPAAEPDCHFEQPFDVVE
jgi:hypothetical protein